MSTPMNGFQVEEAEAVPELAQEPNPIGWSLHVFFVDGAPRGIRKIGKDNWNGVVYEFEQSDLQDACAQPELSGTGVYLFVADGADHEGLPRIYVGEADSLSARLPGSRSRRDWWNRALAFTAVDGSITKAHALHIEARLCAIAKFCKRCDLDNDVNPKFSLQGEARAMAEGFLKEMLTILPGLGVDAFERVSREAQPQTPELILEGRGIRATGFETSQGFLVKTGATAVAEPADSLPETYKKLRIELKEKGVLAEADGRLELVQDYVFGAPSAAAGVLMGNAINGRTVWKTAEGTTLKDLQELPKQDELSAPEGALIPEADPS